MQLKIFSKLILFILIVILNKNIYAQNYQWNPLHTGDLWEFVDVYSDSWYKKVLKDTLIEGKTYYKVYQFSNWDGIVYERNRENAVYMYDVYDYDNNPETKELLCDSLNVPVGTKYISYRYFNRYSEPCQALVTEKYRDFLSVYNDSSNIVVVSYVPVSVAELPKTNKVLIEESEHWAEKYGICYSEPELNNLFLVGAVINDTTYGTISKIEKNKNDFPNDFKLYQNYPNPFNSSTIISFNIRRYSKYKIDIYNMNGSRIISYSGNSSNVQTISLHWNGLDENGTKVSTGLYIYVLTTTYSQSSKKMLLLQ